MKRVFQSEAVWKPEGRGFSMGVIQPQGVTVHLTGQVAWDAQSRLIGAGDAAAQAVQCLLNIQRLLAEVGGRLDDVVSVTTYFVHLEDLPAIQAVRAEYFGGAAAPVSTSVRVAGLGDPGFLVEMTPIAVVPAQRYVDPPSALA